LQRIYTRARAGERKGGEEKGKKRDEGKRDEGMVNLEIVPPPIVLA